MAAASKPGAFRSFSLLLLVTCFGMGQSAPAQAAAASMLHSQAPELSRMTLDHQPVSLRAFRGKVVLLNFWATWCAPCLTEMPQFSRWQQRYKRDGLQVIGVSMDDTEAPVAAATAELKLTYPVVMGDEHIGAAYGGVLGLPVTFLIDRKGTIRARYESAVDLAQMRADLEKLLSSD